jgi:hypothetical protein
MQKGNQEVSRCAQMVQQNHHTISFYQCVLQQHMHATLRFYVACKVAEYSNDGKFGVAWGEAALERFLWVHA